MGKTNRDYTDSGNSWKHPHVHGEDAWWNISHNLNQETPPRAWGRLERGHADELTVRNTPTCMGKTIVI